MKDDITNFSLQPSILSSKEDLQKRLIVVTGKGGVGKTTLAMAVAKYLKEQHGRKVLYNSFDQPLNSPTLTKLNIPHFTLCMDTSAKEYIARKLGSETIAGWILKTPFFSSLFNMLPGLGHMILLGHIISRLEEDPELTIVIDSPSSGHAVTMFESPLNFREMFRTGLIVDDIDRMENFLHKDKQLQVIITALATEMATQEALDLSSELSERNIEHIDFILNDLMSMNPEVLSSRSEDLPDFIKTKCNLEDSVREKVAEQKNWMAVPHYAETDPIILVNTIVKNWKEANS